MGVQLACERLMKACVYHKGFILVQTDLSAALHSDLLRVQAQKILCLPLLK